jgi:hypothetical protein
MTRIALAPFALCLALTLWLAGPAAARGPADTSRAEADRMIAGTTGPQLYANDTAPGAGAIVIRHKESGYSCLFNPGADNTLSFEGDPAKGGADFLCIAPLRSFTVTVYITRAPGYTAAEAQTETMAGRTKESGKLTPATFGRAPIPGTAPGFEDRGPPHVGAWYTDERDGQKVFLFAGFAQKGDWIITFMAAGALENEGVAEGLIRMMWATSLVRLEEAPKP